MKDYGLPVSAALHALVLAAAIIALPSAQPLAPAEESLPVEIVTPEQFAAITKGEKTAKPAEKPQVKVDKVAEEKPAEDDPTPDVKREAVATPTPPQPKIPDPVPEPPKPVPRPDPEPPKPDVKPEQAKLEPPKPEPKPEPARQPDEQPKPEPKPIPKTETQKLDELALKAAEEEKPEPKKDEPQKPQPKKVADKSPEVPPEKQQDKPSKPASKPAEAQTRRVFDPSKVADLLSKDKPARAARTGAETATTAALGSTRGKAPRLSLSERMALIGAIRSHVDPCWNKPAFAADPSKLAVLINVSLNPDGTMSADPEVIKYPAGSGGAAAANAAMRALKRCITTQSPLKLPPNLYASWKEIEVNFDPST